MVGRRTQTRRLSSLASRLELFGVETNPAGVRPQPVDEQWREAISYKHTHMAKQAISVTLDPDNLTWLKGRAGAAGLRSVSELLDQLVTAARASGRTGPSRSVAGTIDIDAGDPLLEGADEAVRRLYETSLGRPLLVKESPVEFRAPRRKKARRG